MRGLSNARAFHEQNSGLPYHNFKLEKHGDSAIVRVLQPEADWVNFFVHQAWDNALRKFAFTPTRCPSETVQRDPENCAACALGNDVLGRTLKTFIPVRVREMTPQDRVDIISYGRNGLDAVINIITELPKGQDITMVDIKVKRQGTGTDTQYYWMLTGQARPLSAEEKSLEVPDMDALWSAPPEIEMDRRVRQFAQSQGIKPVGLPPSSPTLEEAEPQDGTETIPF